MGIRLMAEILRPAVAMLVLVVAESAANADSICGPREDAYLQKLISGLQPYAQQVTASGKFAAENEYGAGTMAVTISFLDGGKRRFSYRSADTAGDDWGAIGARPGSTKAGQPGFAFYFAQGKSGACEANVFVKDGRFVTTPIRFVR